QLAREPGTQFRIHIEWAVSKVDPRVGLLEVEAGHQHLVFQGERGLYETRDSGCCIKVSNVSLYRAEGAKLFWPGLPEGASQRRPFNWVPQDGAGAMSLNICDRSGVNAGNGMGHDNRT